MAMADGSQKNTKLPIIVKGVQSVDDVQLCVDAGVEGVIIVSGTESLRRRRERHHPNADRHSQITEVVS
jgi:isopentenyl diphosphate isomerase/L-lactate dehydrogenase-like FMN-dependent dehydrogenase